MKKIIAMFCVVLMVASMLVGCGGAPKLSGTYVSKSILVDTHYQFDEDYNVTVKYFVGGYAIYEISGTYNINDDKTEITFTFGESDTEAPSNVDVASGTFTFSETENGIMIGKTEYTGQN